MTFSILQWNILYSEDTQAVAGLIKHLNPDIVCLQELTLGYHQDHTNTGQYIGESLGYNAYYDYGPMLLPNGQSTAMGNGIFSHFPIQNQSRVTLKTGQTKADAVIADERFYLQAEIKFPHHIITVGTTHLPFHLRLRTSPAKQAMVNAILATTAMIKTPYIFAADLNSTPHSKAARTFRQHLSHAGPNLKQPTWATKPFHLGKYHFEGLHWRLDYVLYKGSIKPTNKQFIQTNMSDHVPILIEFEI